MATPHGRSNDQSHQSNGMGMSPSSVSTTTVRPPTPANANCPNESWPAQPVSIDTDKATMAKPRMRVQVYKLEFLVRNTPRRTRAPNRAANPKRDRLRMYQRLRSRSGMAFTLGDSDHSPSSSVARRANITVITKMAMKKITSTASRISRSTLPWNNRPGRRRRSA